ncbi:hypothetical protein HanIR_Chr05g0236311 [Helianthus annuus]|uniref:uncharacterized protein LOC110939137 n=1 Tax=Helianthus annuus TaxID=4232 RepID=UPI000B8F55EF|nr:uncharacterized protein LOC110939137 [Helianthus annuus]KAJ0577463.1 hypothetical protein HanIR_Chr05g0236311 [Helianthus annuus]
MTPMVKLISLLLLISLMSKDVYGQEIEDCKITILQREDVTPAPSGYWRVWIGNPCYSCSIGQVKLSCKGFNLNVKTDPNIIYKEGDFCIINNNQTLTHRSTVQFTYAADTPYRFEVVHQSKVCD